MVVGFAAMEGIKKKKERETWMYGYEFRLTNEQKNRWSKVVGVGLAKEAGIKDGEVFWVKYNKETGYFHDYNSKRRYLPSEIKLKRK